MKLTKKDKVALGLKIKDRQGRNTASETSPVDALRHEERQRLIQELDRMLAETNGGKA
tara:strand:+ start:568 stop:741 length:174 start_codon:yes stop_codon:yes gene_type:complete